MTRKPLTPHQREVFARIERAVRRNGYAEQRYIGCDGACSRLMAKGWITGEVVPGPRGGEHWRYRLTADQDRV